MEILAPSPQTTLLILLGASVWPYSPEFQSSEAFANAAHRLKDYFLNPRPFGLPDENVLDLFDSNHSPDELDVDIRQFLEQRMAAMKASGHAARDILVYFVGHGGFVGRDADFYLAIRRTRMDNPRPSGVQMISLADTLIEKARHLRRIIILDCCFAAAAFSAFQSEPAQVAVEKTRDAFEVKRKGAGFSGKGTALLCSSNHKSPSLLLPDGSSTMFTKALVDALGQGTMPELEYLSLREVAGLAAEALVEIRNAPRPIVHSPDQSEGDIADIPFFPNPRAEEERARLEEEQRRRAEEERARQEEEAQRKAEQDRLRKREEEAKARQAEEERARLAEKQARKIEEEEQARKAEEEKRRQAEEEGLRKTEVLPSDTDDFQESVVGAIETPGPELQRSEESIREVVQLSTGSQRISRRKVLAVLAAGGVAVAGGGIGSIIWWAGSPHLLYTYHGHSDNVVAVLWSPDGKRIVSGSDDKTVQIWDASDGGHGRTFPIDSQYSHWRWSPDGKRIASSNSNTVQVWDVATGSIAYTYRGHTAPVTAVTWSPDSRRIASGSADKTVQVWDAADGSNVYTYRGHTGSVFAGGKVPSTYHRGPSGAVWAVVWSPDGKLIASGAGDKTVQVWQAP